MTVNKFNQSSLLVFFVAFIALTLMHVLFDASPITGDDSWAAAASLGSTLDVIVFTLRWDLHPPLYYLFVDTWAWFGHSDLWLRMSSMLLHSAVTGFVFAFTKQRYNGTAALSAALLVFTSPLLLAYSNNLRMYSFIALFSFSHFYLTERFVTGQDKRKRYLLLNGAVLVCCHAIGIAFVFFHFFYGVLSLGMRDKRKLFKWTVIHFLVFLLSLPVIANSFLRSVSHAQVPDIGDVGHLVSHLFASQQPVIAVIAVGLFVFALFRKETRLLTISYFFAPILVFFVVSNLVKPLWIHYNFAFVLPVLGVVLAVVIASLPLPHYAKIIAVLGASGFHLSQWDILKQPDDFALFQQVEAINTFRDAATPDDKLCVISESPLGQFWSLQRYLIGPEWGDPIAVQPPLNDRWQALANKMPTPISNLLALAPTPNFSVYDDLIITAAYSERCSKSDVNQIIFVGTQEISFDGFDLSREQVHGVKIFQRY